MLRASWAGPGRAGAAAVPRARPARPPGLVEPGLDAPAALREGPRARRVQGQGPALHRGREAVAARQAARAAGPDHPAAPQAGRPRPGRADDDALTTTRSCRCCFDKRLAREAMPDVDLPGYRDGYPEDAEVHVRRAVESHIAQFGERPRGHVAERGLGLPGDDPAAGPARHPVDRHRRGDPRLLDPRQGRPRQPGPRPPSRAALPRLEGRARADHELAIVFRDHSMSDQVGFHYQRSPGPGRRGRLPRQAARHRRRLPAQPRDARPGDPRRRELLGVLPRRRRLVPPLALPGRGARPADQAGRRSASSSASIRRPTPCRGSSPGAGSATTSRSGSAIPRTTAAGTPCTRPAQFLVGRGASRPARPATSSPGPGKRSTSPRAPTGSGGTATTTPAPRTRLFDHLFRKHLRNVYTLLGCDPPGSLFTPISQAGGPPADPRPADQLPERQGRRPRHLLRVDRRGPLRLRQRARDDDAGDQGPAPVRSGSASTPSGS